MANEKLAAKTADQFRDDITRTIYNGERARGVATPNVAPGSDAYVKGQALGNQLETLSASAIQAGEDLMPDSASSIDVVARWLAAVGSSLRGAGPSNGKIVFATSAATPVATGAELLTPTGARVRVVTGGVFSDGNPVDVVSVDNGKAQNLDPGAVLRWVTPPPFAASTCPVDAAGRQGGVDAEDIESARARLLYLLGHPPSSGNASHCSKLAEDAVVEVQRALCYPAANGPSTVHMAYLGYAANNALRSRVVTAPGVAAANAAVVGELPEHAEVVGGSVVDLASDASFIIQIPSATTAIPAGSGSGWVDGAPFPSVSGIDPTRVYCAVTLVTNTTSVRVESMVAPAVGQTVCYVPHTGTKAFQLLVAKILTQTTNAVPVGTTPGTYNITVDTPLLDVAVGDYVFPGALRAADYVAAVLATYGLLGPGEKTDRPGLLPRAYRKPRPYEQYPYSLAGQFLKALEDSGPEVLSADWGYRNGGTTTPPLPTSIALSPKVFVPRRLAVYQDPSA